MSADSDAVGRFNATTGQNLPQGTNRLRRRGRRPFYVRGRSRIVHHLALLALAGPQAQRPQQQEQDQMWKQGGK
ncbi:hypothetical protein MTO96_009475 [Rhipicephalus appendiculatus]